MSALRHGMQRNRVCTKCRIEKPLSDFHKQPSGPLGRHSWCKGCFNKYARETRNKQTTPEQKRRWNLATRYRLSEAQVSKLLAAQGGVCAICGDPPKRPCVDHDHTTGKVRGILCHHCNIRLPAMEDRVFRRLALRYLGGE